MTEVRTLDDICSAIVDCAHKTAPIDPDGDYFAVGTPAMRGHIIDYAQARRIDRETYDAWTTRLVPRYGDLLLAREAPVGPVVRIPKAENVAPGQRTVLLRPREGVTDASFLFYYLTSPRIQAELQTKAAGSTVAHLNVADVRALPTPDIPDLATQRSIAEVLGALDDKIAANDRTVESAVGLMVALGLSASETTTVGELATPTMRSLKPDEFDEVVAHYSLPAYDAGQVPERAERETIKSNKFALAEPCVLISKLNPRIPRIWDVCALPDGMAVGSTEFVTLVPREISTSCLWAVLSAPAISTELEGLVAGTSGSHQRVKPAELLNLEVGDPRTLDDPVREQIATLGVLVHAKRLESERLAATRNELLPLLMSGKLRVRDAEKRAEAVL